MKRNVVLTGGLILAAVIAAAPSAARTTRGKGTVKVHCSQGSNAAFVTPRQVRINLGDVVEWASAGNVVADSIKIELKDANQAWPVEGGPPAGGDTVSTGAANNRGTYGYTVKLVCRRPGGNTHEEIDPDIIID
jgi:plastocyanin